MKKVAPVAPTPGRPYGNGSLSLTPGAADGPRRARRPPSSVARPPPASAAADAGAVGQARPGGRRLGGDDLGRRPGRPPERLTAARDHLFPSPGEPVRMDVPR